MKYMLLQLAPDTGYGFGNQMYSLSHGLDYAIQNKYNNQLHQIIFINNSWHIKAVIKAGSIALCDSLQSKIKMLDDRVYSVLEFL